MSISENACRLGNLRTAISRICAEKLDLQSKQREIGETTMDGSRLSDIIKGTGSRSDDEDESDLGTIRRLKRIEIDIADLIAMKDSPTHFGTKRTA
jgi:hypothetical protein